MEEAYWRKFIDLKIAEEYFFLYGIHSRNRLIAINVFCLAVSCTGIVAWFNDLNPMLSSFIVLAAQLVSIFQTFYPYSERLYASKLIYNEYKQCALAAEQTFNRYLYGDLKGEELLPALKRLVNNTKDIEDKFCSPDTFSRNKRLHSIAQKNVENYLKIHFNTEE